MQAWRRREAWMTKLVSRIKEYAGGGPVLFGDGANSGLFGRVRGAGVKGPVLEIKKRLSEQMPIIECSEFRTSKLCLDCGRVAKNFYGVTYCTQRDHQRMANRDVAAKKIGARYLAAKQRLSAGLDHPQTAWPGATPFELLNVHPGFPFFSHSYAFE